MSIFEIKKISEIQGKINFFYLYQDGKCEYLEFEEKIRREGNLAGELNTIQSRLHDVSELKLLPQSKFKDITPIYENQKSAISNRRILDRKISK